MKTLKAFSIAGLLLGSVAAHAAPIDLPSFVAFDINADPSTYTFDWTGGPAIDDPTVWVPNINYTVENSTYYSYFNDGGWGEGIMELGLEYIFLGRGMVLDSGRKPITGPILGESYAYTVEFQYFFEDDEACPGTYCDGDYVKETMMVSFFDSATDVPVGPTAPLLAAGLAGLWFRRKRA